MEFNKETDKALFVGALLFATGFLSLVGGIKMQWSIAGTTGTAWVLYLIAFVLIGVGKMFAYHCKE